MAEAPHHAHNAYRATFVHLGGMMQPAPAPRYSVTTTAIPALPRAPGADTDAVLATLGYDVGDISAMRAERIVDG